MRRLNKDIISKICLLRKKGRGFKTIAKQLNLSPATIHKYAKEIKLSKSAKYKLIKSQRKRQEAFRQSFAQEKDINEPELDEQLANILGHLFFDGSVPKEHNGKYLLNYTNSSLEAISNFVNSVENAFQIKPQKIQKTKGKNVDWYEVCFSSKKAWQFVRTFSKSFSTKENVGIPKQIFDAQESVKCAFLRAFWDDEGTIGYIGYLTGASKSEKMIIDLVKMHCSLGLNCTKTSSKKVVVHTIRIRKELKNFMLFSKKVGFGYGRVIRGHNLGRFKKDVLQDIINSSS